MAARQPKVWCACAAAAVLLVAGALVGTLSERSDNPRGRSHPARGTFLPASVSCERAVLAPGSQLGIALVVPSRVLLKPLERAAYYGAITCFQQISPSPIVLRANLPIDIAMRKPGDHEFGELDAFIELARELEPRVTPIITFRGASVSAGAECGVPIDSSAAPTTSPVSPETFSGLLGRCEYPTPALYAQLFAKVHSRVDRQLPNVLYGVWNEPDHRGFTLVEGRPAGSPSAQVWAAEQSARYWIKANEQAPGRVLAGEFSSNRRAIALKLAYTEVGAQVPPDRWALHPYGDLGVLSDINAPTSLTNEFFAVDTPAWLTEFGVRLDGQRANGDAAGQYASGEQLRKRLEIEPTRIALYGLTSGGSSFDSSLGDQTGAARPFVCGLAGIARSYCTGSPYAFSP